MRYIKFLPKNLLSRVVGRMVAMEHPKVAAHWARDAFAKHYKINLDEAEMSIDEYPNIGALFTRRLKAGVRPIGEGIVHPCDGMLTAAQAIASDSLLQAKGLHYSLSDLIAEPKTAIVSATFIGGVALTYYLCPTDYHRVHSPIDGDVTKVTHVPGTLWPVNDASVKWVSQLFAINERLIFHLSTPLGPALLVMVGATNVGKMTVSFDPSISTNLANSCCGLFCQGKVQTCDYIYPRADFTRAIHLVKGEELGIFNMGSTVIVLYPPSFFMERSGSGLPHKGLVRMGQSV